MPSIASVTVITVMSTLSAKGSIIVPSKLFMLYFLAICPSNYPKLVNTKESVCCRFFLPGLLFLLLQITLKLHHSCVVKRGIRYMVQQLIDQTSTCWESYKCFPLIPIEYIRECSWCVCRKESTFLGCCCSFLNSMFCFIFVNLCSKGIKDDRNLNLKLSRVSFFLL